MSEGLGYSLWFVGVAILVAGWAISHGLEQIARALTEDAEGSQAQKEEKP